MSLETPLKGMKVKVINLDRRPDRWQRFSSQMGVQRLGQIYTVERFSAVDGKTIQVETDERISMRTKRNIKYRTRRTHEDIDTVGAIGCYLSHVQIWKEFVQSGASAVMVLEDDALIPPTFLETFQKCSQDLSEVQDLNMCIWSLAQPQAFFEIDRNTFRDGAWVRNIATTFTGYVLFRGCAQKLLENCMPIDNHVDLMTYQATQLGLISSIHHPYLLLHQLAIKKGDSNIQENKCALCDIPNKPEQKGFLILSPQKQRDITVGSVLFGIAAIGLYFYTKKK